MLKMKLYIVFLGVGCEGEDEHMVITGAFDRRVRVFDTRLPRRTHCVQVWQVWRLVLCVLYHTQCKCYLLISFHS